METVMLDKIKLFLNGGDIYKRLTAVCDEVNVIGRGTSLV